ncbi:hypothetical protein H0H87_012617 [Tephrocybe sp. NHM501043]|nr:hypothetical protein H0H87_012617 [Tephrocybe sp. NHM501043]
MIYLDAFDSNFKFLALQYVPPPKEKEPNPAQKNPEAPENIPVAPKVRNPLNDLPKSTFNLEDWKCQYSNNNTWGASVLLKWFH